jgi:1,2-dihydroxy-3-keto-5-methylthiopentene dioxygenase
MGPGERDCDAAALRDEGILCEAFAVADVETHVKRARLARALTRDASRRIDGVSRRDADRIHEADEHAHGADEIRLFIEGEGVYDVRARDERWIRIWVGAGDAITIPRHRYHRFLAGQSETRWREIFSGPSDLTLLFRASEETTLAS